MSNSTAPTLADQNSPSSDGILPIVQAMLFASEQPISVENLVSLLQTEFVDIDEMQVENVLQQITQQLEGGGLILNELETGYRIEVKDIYLDWVYRLFEQSPPRLSRALLETLAIMAHKQPVTRAEVEAVRGVAVSTQIMGQLRHFGWVKSAGVKEVPGHPMLWVTTQKLLDDLGLASKAQLTDKLDSIVAEFMAEQQEAQRQTAIDI